MFYDSITAAISLNTTSKSNRFKYDLSKLDLYLQSVESLKQDDIQLIDKSRMLQLVYNLYITMQRYEHRLDDLVLCHGINYFIRSLKIMAKLGGFPLIHISNVNEKCEELKRIEYYLLTCIFHLINTNKGCLTQLSSNSNYLWSVFLFITSQQEQCRLLVLKVFTLVASTREGTLRTLDLLTTMSFITKENARFSLLIRMIDYQHSTWSNDTIAESILNLLIQFMSNLRLTERIRIQCELDDAQFCLDSLESNLKRANVLDGNSFIWQTIERLRSYQLDIVQILDSKHFQAEALKLNEEVMQLSLALKLNIKCESLMKTCLRLKNQNISQKTTQCETSTNVTIEEDESIFSDIQSSFSIYDYNMRSTDEEMVDTSIRFSTNSCPSLYLLGTNPKKSRFKNSENVRKEENIPTLQTGSTFVSNDAIDRVFGGKSSNYIDNFKTNKYFAYIMANNDNWETYNQKNKSITNSVAKLFRMKNRRRLVTNPTLVNNIEQSNDNSGCESLLSFDGNNYPPISRTLIKLKHLDNPLNDSMNDQHDDDEDNDDKNDDDGSIKSCSLPKEFRSNFILQRSEIYLPKY